MMTLLIDGDNVAARMFFALPVIHKNSDPSGPRVEVIFGFLRETLKLLDQFAPCRLVFLFDSDKSKRREILPYYKDTRAPAKNNSIDTPRDYRQLERQKDTLRHMLKELGFANVFCEDGYEADDLIASLAQTCEGERVIVSSDHDLWQCLRDGEVLQYDFGRCRMHTAKSFRLEWGVTPRQWARVKAIAGCASDGVPGVKGVGEVTAAKYLKNELGSRCKAATAIAEGKDIIHRNYKLVRLPFDGTPQPRLRDDDLVWSRWPRVLKSYGVDGLRHPEQEVRDVFALERR